MAILKIDLRFGCLDSPLEMHSEPQIVPESDKIVVEHVDHDVYQKPDMA